MATTPDLGIPFLAASQAQPEVTHNEMIVMLQAMLSGAIQVGLNTPPGSPTEGDVYVTGAAPTGAWTSRPNRIAAYMQGEWRFVPDRNSAGTIITMGARQHGMRIWDRVNEVTKVWDGSAWVTAVTSAAMNLHYGQRSITDNSTPLAITAAVDPTLNTDSDYDQVLGIFNAAPDGEVNGITQQTNSFTIQRDGVYEIKVWSTVSSDVNNTELSLKFAVNGVLGTARRPWGRIRNGGERTGISAFGFAEFTAGDVVTLWFASTQTANVTFYDMVFAASELRSL